MNSASPKRTLLFITRIPPVPGGGGSNVYPHDLLTFLQQSGFEVHVLLMEPCRLEQRLPWILEKDPLSGLHQLCPGYVRLGRRWWSLLGIWSSLHNKLARWLKRPCLPPPRESSWGNRLTQVEASWVRTARKMRHWDVVICNYCWLSDALAQFGSDTIKAVLTHDVWHKHVSRSSNNPYIRALDRETEAALLTAADIVIAITEKDAGEFRGMLPDKIVVCAPMSCRPLFSTQLVQPGTLLFVGSGYQPNVDGVTWFLNKVGPILERQMPGRFHLNLVGAVGESVPALDSGIKFKAQGRVENLESEYAAAEIVIVPIHSGTGLKIKLVEAVAHGKAIVTTGAGAQGLENLFGRAFLVADTPEAFASCIMDLSRNSGKRTALEDAAKVTAQKDLSPEACYALLAKILRADKSE